MLRHNPFAASCCQPHGPVDSHGEEKGIEYSTEGKTRKQKQFETPFNIDEGNYGLSDVCNDVIRPGDNLRSDEMDVKVGKPLNRSYSRDMFLKKFMK